MRRAFLLLVASAATACVSGASSDVATTPDATEPRDSGRFDAIPHDAGFPDAEEPDLSFPDAEEPDAGPGKVHPVRSEVEVDRATGLVAGTDMVAISVIVRDAQGRPVGGVPITFNVTGTGNTVSGVTSPSDDDGRAGARLRSTVAETKTISVFVLSEGQSFVLDDTPEVTFVAAAASQLAFSRRPPTGTAGQPLSPAVEVQALDRYGNLVTSASGNVTLMRGAGGPIAATLMGTLTRPFAMGVATFPDLVIQTAGDNYTLSARSSVAPNPVTSAQFSILPAEASSLSFQTQPANVVAGAAINPPPVVELTDRFGNLATTTAYEVAVRLGANPGGGNLTGTTRVTASGGRARFNDLRIDRTGTGYTLSASTPLIQAPVVSNPFNVLPAVASRLAFTVQPRTSTLGVTLPAVVRVEVQDTLGNRVPSATNTITLAIQNNPGAAALSGMTSLDAVNGIADFNGLTLNSPGTGYTLRANAAGLQMAISTSFDVLTVAEAASAGAMRYLRSIQNLGTGGLPRGQARLSELNNGLFMTSTFSPAQLALWMDAAILSHAYRARQPRFRAGLSSAELEAGLTAAITRLEAMFMSCGAGCPFLEAASMRRALFAVHQVPTGMAPRRNAAEQQVSLVDNAHLMVALQLAATYARTTSVARDLIPRIAMLTQQENLELWISRPNLALPSLDLSRLLLGGANNPRAAGSESFDHILSEARLAAVAARARGEIMQQEFWNLIFAAMSEANPAACLGATTTNPDRLPRIGLASEVFGVTPFLGVENASRLGTRSLIPIADGWEQQRNNLGLASAGATTVPDGRGNLVPIALSPAEACNATTNVRVIVPPAAGLEAGALGTTPANQNLDRTFVRAASTMRFHPVFGFSSALDEGAMLIDEADPTYGTTEIAQMAVALMNRLLGGNFLDMLLRREPGWVTALDEYRRALNTVIVQAEAQSANTGGQVQNRTAASRGQTWHVNPNQSVTYAVNVPTAGNYDLVVRYSNDDTGNTDTVSVLLGATVAGTFQTIDTGDNDLGWEIFVTGGPIPLGQLAAGTAMITLRLDGGDPFGFEPDRLMLVPR